MPHVASLICHANRLLDGTDADSQKGTLKAVAGASTMLDAAERAGLLEQFKGPFKKQARAALQGLPASIDSALLAVLKGGLERNLPVVLQWKPGPYVELQIWETVEDGEGHIGVLLVTPFARDVRTPRRPSSA